jgi:hypothetical protein
LIFWLALVLLGWKIAQADDQTDDRARPPRPRRRQTCRGRDCWSRCFGSDPGPEYASKPIRCQGPERRRWRRFIGGDAGRQREGEGQPQPLPSPMSPAMSRRWPRAG